jgi:hypothetical protein
MKPKKIGKAAKGASCTFSILYKRIQLLHISISISFSWSSFNPCFRVHSLLMRILIWIQAKISMQIRIPAAPKQECDTLTAQKFNTAIVENETTGLYIIKLIFCKGFPICIPNAGQGYRRPTECGSGSEKMLSTF